MPKQYPVRAWAWLDRLWDRAPGTPPAQAARKMSRLLACMEGLYGSVTTRTLERARDRYYWNGTSRPYYRHRKGHKRMTAADVKELGRFIARDPALFLDELGDELRTTVGKSFKEETISKWLRKPVADGGLGLTKKVLEERAKQRDRLKRGMYCDTVARLVASWLVFIDESHKDNRSQRRRRGWARRGHPAIVYKSLTRGTKYSMIGACDLSGMIIDACTVVEGNVNSDVLNKWTEEELCPVPVALPLAFPLSPTSPLPFLSPFFFHCLP